MSAGVLYVHSAPPALCPHVEWAVAAELGVRVSLTWTDQPASPGLLRAESGWRGRPGTAGRLAAALRGWTPLRYEVTEEPSPGLLRAETGWRGRPGTAGRLAAALRGWTPLRYEVTEEPSPGADGERYSVTPALGVFRATTSANGDIVVPEDRLRAALSTVSGPALSHELDRLLGSAWDDELEPYRHAGAGASVTWLHQVV